MKTLEEYSQLLEEDKVFCICKKTVKDDEGTYAIEGKEYWIERFIKDEGKIKALIEGEEINYELGQCVIAVPLNDENFEFIIEE